jgi:hypothetical protein
VIQFTAGTPPTYIAEGGGLTYQFVKARRYASKADAEKRMAVLQMPTSWEAVGYAIKKNALPSSRTNDLDSL